MTIDYGNSNNICVTIIVDHCDNQLHNFLIINLLSYPNFSQICA